MIDGKKLIIGMVAMVVLIGVITFALYLLTRQDDVEDDGSLTPNAIVVQYESAVAILT